MTELKIPGITFLDTRTKKKWRAKCHFNSKGHHIGYYDTQEEAIRARDEFLISHTSVYSLKEITIATQALKWLKSLYKEKYYSLDDISEYTMNELMSKMNSKSEEQLFKMFINRKK